MRYEDSPLGSDRVLVCYRNASLDPLTTSDPPRTTTRWLSPPLNRPLQAFIGIGSNALVARSADWIVAGAEDAPELFTETGFKNGDVVSNLVGYEYDGLWTPGAGKDLPEGLTVLGQAPVIPASPLQTQRQFAVAYEWSDAAPIRLGRLSAIVQTLQVGPSWTLMVSVVSAKGLVFLQYETEIGTPYQYKVGPVPYAIIPLDATFSQLGTRPLDRDLNADYTTAFGTPPTDARVTAIVVRGSLALGALSITESDGTTYPTSKNVGTLHEANVWYVSEGKGTIGVQSGDPSPTAPLLIQATLPTDKRPDVSNTVVIKRAALGLVIAAGTIQWSWALDDYGDHVDHQGNSTKVDRRLQTLTGNLLRQLIKGTR